MSEEKEPTICSLEELKEKVAEIMPNIVRPWWTADCHEAEDEEDIDSDSSSSSSSSSIDEDDEDSSPWSEENFHPLNPFTSKFGGCDPWLDEGKGWPECKECELKKTFICQLVVQELPEAIRTTIDRQEGLFQCFACLECMDFPKDPDGPEASFVKQEEVSGDKGLSLKSLCARTVLKMRRKRKRWDFGRELPRELARYVDKFDLDKAGEEDGAEAEEEEPKAKKKRKSVRPRVKRFREKRISSWDRMGEEIPGPFEFGGIEEEVEERLGAAVSSHLLEDYSSICYDKDDPSSLVKLGGYIQWIQGHNSSCQVAYPKCQGCGGIEMDKTFLYLRQGDDLEYEWGEDGMAFVAVCPKCKRPELNWASI